MRGALAFLACLLAASGARALECEGPLGVIRDSIEADYAFRVPCDELRAAAKVLRPAWISESQQLWTYEEELSLREGLWNRYGIRLSTSILPIGTVERISPEGPGMLIVFAFDLPRRAWPFYAWARTPGRPSASQTARAIGHGIVYNEVGFYMAGAEARVRSKGTWFRFKHGNSWAQRPAPLDTTRACFPCTGWLCPKEPIVCFAAIEGRGEDAVILSENPDTGVAAKYRFGRKRGRLEAY